MACFFDQGKLRPCAHRIHLPSDRFFQRRNINLPQSSHTSDHPHLNPTSTFRTTPWPLHQSTASGSAPTSSGAAASGATRKTMAFSCSAIDATPLESPHGRCRRILLTRSARLLWLCSPRKKRPGQRRGKSMSAFSLPIAYCD